MFCVCAPSLTRLWNESKLPLFSPILFAKDNTSQMQLMIKVVSDFCNACGLEVNHNKSRVMCSENMSRRVKHDISNLCSLKFSSSLCNYLGFTLIHGTKLKISNLNLVLDGI